MDGVLSAPVFPFALEERGFRPFFIACGGPLRGAVLQHGCGYCSRAPAANAEGRVGGGGMTHPCPAGQGCQSADKAHNRKNRSDKIKIRSDFCFRRQQNLHPAVTYVYVSSLGCKFASLACGLSHRSASLLTLSTSWPPCPAGQGCAAGVRIRRCLPLRGKSASEWRA